MTALPIRPLGTQGLVSSSQGYGCMGLSGVYLDTSKADGKTADEEGIKVLHRALELGITHFDTSDAYGPYTNEVLVSKALAGRKIDCLATKFAIKFSGGNIGLDGSREYVRSAVEASLQRLGVSQIDLYYQHRVDRSIPLEVTWNALKELKDEGKVKYLGVSEASADEIRRAHAITPISAVQLEWSLWSRDAEEEVIPTCRELGIGIVAYSPLGRGLLTGTILSSADMHKDDWRLSGQQPRFEKENLDKNLALVERVRSIAAAKGCTPGQLALAWVHNQGDDVFPIPGTKHIKYLEENVAAAHIKLTAAEKKAIEDIFDPAQVAGDRYPAAWVGMTHQGAKISMEPPSISVASLKAQS